MSNLQPDPLLTSEWVMELLAAPLESAEKLTIWIKTHPVPQAVIQTLRNMFL